MSNFVVLASALLQNDDVGLLASIFSSTISCLCSGIIFLIVVIGLWKVFVKADEPGWAAIIPIYNYYVILKIVGRPWWWLLLLLIPIVNLIVSIPLDNLSGSLSSFLRSLGKAIKSHHNYLPLLKKKKKNHLLNI